MRGVGKSMVALAIAALGFGVWWMWPKPMPEPPRPAELTHGGEELASLIDRAAERVNADRRDAAAWFDLAMVYGAGGFFELSEFCFEQGLGLQGQAPKAWYHLALVREELEKLDEAIIAMRRCIELDSTYAPAHWRLGQWLLDRDQIDAAADAFERALQVDRGFVMAEIGLARVQWERGDAEQARTILENAAQRPGGHQSYANQLLAWMNHRDGRADEAATAMRRVSGEKPTWSDPWHSELNRFRASRSARLREANGLLNRGEHAAAIAILDQIVRDIGEDRTVASNLGYAYLLAGQPQRAIAELSRAAQTYPDSYAIQLNLAAALHQTGSHSIALQHVNRAIMLNPRSPAAHDLKVKILLKVGDAAAAAECLRERLQWDQHRTELLVNLGRQELELSQWRSAADTFALAIRLNAQDAAAWQGLVEAHLKGGDRAEAAASLEQARIELGDHPSLRRFDAEFEHGREGQPASEAGSGEARE